MTCNSTIHGFGAGLLLLGLTASASAQDFDYVDFASVAGLTFVGNATQTGNLLRVTPAAGTQTGAAYFTTPVRVAQGFDTRFRFQMTALGAGGADGLTFILHNDPRGVAALASGGGELGYGALAGAPAGTAIANSLVLELDTYLSGAEGDLSANTVSVHTNGPGDNDNDESYSLGQVIPVQNLSDGAIHEVRLQQSAGTLNVFLDDMNTPLISVPYDIEMGGQWSGGGAVGGLSLQPGGLAYVGFTAATGGAWEAHDVLSWSWSSNGGPGTSFCFGDASGLICPCGNLASAGEGCGNSMGVGGALGSEGSASVAAATFQLKGSQLPPNRPCLFVQADTHLNNGNGALSGDGLRCTGSNAVNLGVVWIDLAGDAASQPGLLGLGGVSAGDTKVYQLLYRDPLGPCGQGYNGTNSLEVSFTP